jgi:Skp family chaperone for outer membrane proteins
MKYYSENLKKLFDSEEELTKAEKEHEEELTKKQELADTKKQRAEEVELAYKKTLEAREKANELIKEADKAYLELRDKFVEDFGSYHMTYSNADGKELVSVSDIVDSMFDFWKNLPW